MPYALSVGMVQAGEWSSNVPDRLVAEGRFGVQLDEDPRLARARFEDVVNEVAVKDPWLRENRPVVTWPGGQFASGSTDADHPLIGEMSDGRRRDRRRAPAAGRRCLRQRPAALHRHRRHPDPALRSRRHRRRARAAGEGRPRPARPGHPRADGARAAPLRRRGLAGLLRGGLLGGRLLRGLLGGAFFAVDFLAAVFFAAGSSACDPVGFAGASPRAVLAASTDRCSAASRSTTSPEDFVGCSGCA